MKARCFFQHGAQHVEVISVKLATVGGFLKFCNDCNMMEKRCFACLSYKESAIGSLGQKQLSGLAKLVAKHIEKQRVMGGYDCFQVVVFALEKFGQMAGNLDCVMLIE